jgi:spoIIIJ-associated protein
MERVETIIIELLSAMGYTDAKVKTIELGGQTVFSIINIPDTRELIGQHGDTIHAIDTLVKKMVEKHASPDSEGGERAPMFLVDVDDYRVRHIKDLQTKAKIMAERARSFQYDVELSPMTSYERLIVHTTLQDEPNIKTESQGEGRNRRVVIKYSVQ